MYDLSETQSYQIAQYGFGKVIEQHGFSVLSCDNARLHKKIFGHDPDIQQIQPDFDVLTDWIEKNPDGKVAADETVMRKYYHENHRMTVHHRTLVFTSEWRSDSINVPWYSIIYKKGASTHIKLPGVTRLISQEAGGSSFCAGPDDFTQYERFVHKYETNGTFRPKTLGSIIIPSEDCFIQGTVMKKHFAFKCTVDREQSLVVTKPTYILEFTTNPVNTLQLCRDWFQQYEDGLIKIVDRSTL